MILNHHGHLTDLEKSLVGWIGLSMPKTYDSVRETEIHGANNVDYQEKQHEDNRERKFPTTSAHHQPLFGGGMPYAWLNTSSFGTNTQKTTVIF